jgi:hypothetical protein
MPIALFHWLSTFFSPYVPPQFFSYINIMFHECGYSFHAFVNTLMNFFNVKLMTFIEWNFPPKFWERISSSIKIFHFVARFSKSNFPYL